MLSRPTAVNLWFAYGSEIERIRIKIRIDCVTLSILTFSFGKLFQRIGKVKPERIHLIVTIVQSVNENLEHQPQLLDANAYKRRLRWQF